MKGEEASRFREVAGVYTLAAGCLRSAVDTSTFFNEVAARSYMHALTIQCIVGKLKLSPKYKGGRQSQEFRSSYATTNFSDADRHFLSALIV